MTFQGSAGGSQITFSQLNSSGTFTGTVSSSGSIVNTRVITTTTTLVPNDQIIIATMSGTGFDVNLLSVASVCNQEFEFKRVGISTSNSTLSLVVNGSDRIDESTMSYTMTQPNEYHRLVADCVNNQWRVSP